MKLEARMRQSIKRRSGYVVLREDVAHLGSKTQVSHVLNSLLKEGVILRLSPGVFAKTNETDGGVRVLGSITDILREASKKLGIAIHEASLPSNLNVLDSSEIVVETDNPRISRKMLIDGVKIQFHSAKPKSQDTYLQKPKGVASYVEKLARKHKVHYVENSMDLWAGAVTRLAGDSVKSDHVEDLLVALKRAGKISQKEVAHLAVSYLRERKQGVRSV